MKLDRVIAIRDNKTVYRDGDRCVKLFNEGYSKSDIFNEALNQARVEETGLHVPKVIEVTTVDGKWAIVSEYIQGKTLEQLMAENPHKLGEYIELFVDLQLEIHSKSSPCLNKLKDRMRSRIFAADIDATVRYDLHARLERMPKHNKVCHGDFNPSNIMITEDGTPYILDWSHATRGNAAADVARSYLQFWMKGENEAAELYIESFCNKTSTDRGYVEKWMPIVAAAWLVKGTDKEREFLSSWFGVLDYQYTQGSLK